MKNAGLFVILIFRRKTFEKSTCFLLAGLTRCYLMASRFIMPEIDRSVSTIL